jgi:uncharacterized membrane protein YphA (DoxX/SURF4 family)
MRDELFLVGRILFVLVFLTNGIAHFTNTEASAQYAAYKRVPAARAMVLLSGGVMLAGTVGVALGIWMDLAALALAVFVLVAAFAMHRYWEESDAQTLVVERAQFMKNVSIAGGALIIVAVAANAPYTITDALF